MIDFDLDRRVTNKYELYERKRATEGPRPYAGCQVKFCYDLKSNKVEVKSFLGRDIWGKDILSVKKDIKNGLTIRGIPKKILKRSQIRFSNFFPIIWPLDLKTRFQQAREIWTWHFHTQSMWREISLVFDNLKYIAPIRERIPRYGIMGTMPFSELGPSGQNLMRVLSTSEALEFRRKSVLNELNYWLGNKFKLLRNIHVETVDAAGTIRTLIGDERKGMKHINLASMGFGISQLVPVVVHVVLLPESGCLLVEQPEIHLHPSAQADLADLFIENIKHNRQFIIETHSEHFLLRLRRRVAEGRIKPGKVKILFVEKVRGLTKVKQASLQSNGHFVEWPSGFFEEGYKEALAIAQAAYKQ